MKNLFLPLMLFAIGMSSCSKDQPNISDSSTTQSSDLVGINVYSGTTRALDTTTETLETTSGEVVLHIDDSGSIQSTYYFYYQNSDWAQDDTDAIAWSKITFPANFYSMHDGDPLEGLSFTSEVATYTNYTVTGESWEHKDLVYHASVLNAMPTGGAVSLYHKHALSKIHLYAATDKTKVYIARVRLVNIDGEGVATIKPVAYDEITTASGISWTNSESDFETYLYHYIGDEKITSISSASGTNPIITEVATAPLMIIPQSTTAAVMGGSENSVVSFTGSYIEVIYYLTDSDNNPIVGYSSVAARPDAADYIEDNQPLALFVMGAFPLEATFYPNMEYDITLGLGASGSTGGILIADYYVDKSGIAVDLTKVDGDDDDDDGTTEIPGIEEGDYILGDADDPIDIIVTANSWDDGEDVDVEQE